MAWNSLIENNSKKPKIVVKWYLAGHQEVGQLVGPQGSSLHAGVCVCRVCVCILQWAWYDDDLP